MGGQPLSFTWMENANCKDIETNKFFVVPRTPEYRETINLIRQLCSECAVKDDCLDYALRHEPFGFWGGMTEAQRVRHRVAKRIPMRQHERGR